MDLLTFTSNGIYCPPADVYLDPWRKVQRALISHAHSDHARWGSQAYLSSKASQAALLHRLGNISLQCAEYGETVRINGVEFSFHPAGHIVGSSQIRVAHKGEVWVFSGDYKTEADGFCTPFEPVPCDVFITESTFGLPVYRWKPQQEVLAEIGLWWEENAARKICSVLSCYSLGKAQRILANLAEGPGRVFLHPVIDDMHKALREAGFYLPGAERLLAGVPSDELRKALVLVPPGASDSAGIRKLEPYSLAAASGWMNLRGARRRMAADRGFVLSDHADWNGLNQAVTATGAQRVIVTHGYTSVFARWLCEQGLQGEEARTEYAAEAGE